MPEDIRKANHQKLYRYVTKYTAAFWGLSFVKELQVRVHLSSFLIIRGLRMNMIPVNFPDCHWTQCAQSSSLHQRKECVIFLTFLQVDCLFRLWRNLDNGSNSGRFYPTLCHNSFDSQISCTTSQHVCLSPLWTFSHTFGQVVLILWRRTVSRAWMLLSASWKCLFDCQNVCQSFD